MGIFIGDEETITSSTEFSGYAALNASNTGEAYKFIKFMTFKVFERIFTSCVNSLSMTKQQSEIVKSSSANSYAPYSEGFIYHLSRAAAAGGSVTLYITTLSTGEKLFSTEQTSDEQESIKVDFTKLPESKVVCKIVALMFEVINAASMGLVASKTILMKLEKLADQLADKQARKAVNKQIEIFEQAVKGGKVAFVSQNSSAEFMKYDTNIAKDNLGFCYSLLSTTLGYPAEFFNGVGGSSLSDTGASTEKAIRRADEHYCLSVIMPFIKEVFGYSLEMKPVFENLESIYASISFIETTEILTDDDKRKILMAYGLSGEGVGNSTGGE